MFPDPVLELSILELQPTEKKKRNIMGISTRMGFQPPPRFILYRFTTKSTKVHIDISLSLTFLFEIIYNYGVH